MENLFKCKQKSKIDWNVWQEKRGQLLEHPQSLKPIKLSTRKRLPVFGLISIHRLHQMLQKISASKVMPVCWIVSSEYTTICYAAPNSEFSTAPCLKFSMQNNFSETFRQTGHPLAMSIRLISSCTVPSNITRCSTAYSLVRRCH